MTIQDPVYYNKCRMPDCNKEAHVMVEFDLSPFDWIKQNSKTVSYCEAHARSKRANIKRIIRKRVGDTWIKP